MISDEDKSVMLSAAREVVTAAAKGETVARLDPLKEIDYQPMGVFVTLHKTGELRGCIGYIEGVKPLGDAIIEMSEAAATRDPRFAPVTEDELEEIDLEISLLSPLEKIDDPEQIEIGKHGLVIKNGFNKGLLLPQVATENNWDRKTFLEHSCLKANLPSDAWQLDDTEISIFSAEVFSESSIEQIDAP